MKIGTYFLYKNGKSYLCVFSNNLLEFIAMREKITKTEIKHWIHLFFDIPINHIDKYFKNYKLSKDKLIVKFKFLDNTKLVIVFSSKKKIIPKNYSNNYYIYITIYQKNSELLTIKKYPTYTYYIWNPNIRNNSLKYKNFSILATIYFNRKVYKKHAIIKRRRSI